MDPHVFADGEAPSDIMVVAEAPGKNECEQGIPLIGRSGKFYNTKILEPAGLARTDVFTTNSCLCRPEKNRKPLKEELNSCLYFLTKQVEIVDPKLIITLGIIPLYSVCNLHPSGITKLHGKLMLSREFHKRIPVFPLFHPAYCLRGSGLKELAEDVEVLKGIVLKLKETELKCQI
jgi:DNA polymerase